MTKIRINKFIAQSGIASRRKADKLIAEGRVKINGKPITQLGTTINPLADEVTINNKPVKPQEELIYLALNKPKGYITTLKDKHAQKTIADLIPATLKDKGLKPIGRLDKDTEGLLILTNDLELINLLTHPRYEKEKEYEVHIKGTLTPQQKAKLEKGVLLPVSNAPSYSSNHSKTLPCRIHITHATKTQTKLTITLKEGRKRQIRKMFKLFDHPVLYLQRIRISNLKLGRPPIADLKPGQTKLIDKKCLQA